MVADKNVFRIPANAGRNSQETQRPRNNSLPAEGEGMSWEHLIISLTALCFLAIVGGCWAYENYLTKKQKENEK
jgi:hypothetical protein